MHKIDEWKITQHNTLSIPNIKVIICNFTGVQRIIDGLPWSRDIILRHNLYLSLAAYGCALIQDGNAWKTSIKEEGIEWKLLN